MIESPNQAQFKMVSKGKFICNTTILYIYKIQLGQSLFHIRIFFSFIYIFFPQRFNPFLKIFILSEVFLNTNYLDDICCNDLLPEKKIPNHMPSQYYWR